MAIRMTSVIHSQADLTCSNGLNIWIAKDWKERGKKSS